MTDNERLQRYTQQPTALPDRISERVASETDGESAVLYSLADLDGALKQSHQWLILTKSRCCTVPISGEAPCPCFRRSEVENVELLVGLSCSQLVIRGPESSRPLASLYFSHRQRPAMENIKYLLENPESEVPGESADDIYRQGLTRPIEEAQAAVSEHGSSVLYRLMGYLFPYRWRFTAGVMSALLLASLQLVPPFLTGYLIDTMVRPVLSGDRAADTVRAEALWLIVLLGLAYAGTQFVAWIRMRSMAIMGELVARDLRKEAYAHLQRLSLSFYSTKQTGSLISRVSSDTDRLWDFIAWGVVDFLVALISLTGLSIVLLYLDWRLGLVMTLPLPFLLMILFYYGSRMQKLFVRAWRRWGKLTAVLADAIPGVRVVKAFHQEGRERDRFDNSNEQTLESFNQIHRTWTSFWPVLWLCVQGMTLGVWFFAMPRLLGYAPTAEPLSLGVFVSFTLYMGMYLHPIEILGRLTFILNRATSSAHRVFEILDTQPDIVECDDPTRLEPVQGRVEFENVSFAYDGVRAILKNVDFAVAPGEMIGLVGPSGAGKSTITNLIARFYDATHGCIRIDGVDVRELELGHFRKQLGIVLQDPHLFHGSILDNIRYGMPEADLEAVVDAARAANAHDFICQLHQGYDTVVGERGHTLSGGERQRVSIARALLCNPRVLILDEATSSVDTETEHKIQEALDKLVEGRTVFAIAHRLSTLRRANRLFVVDEGCIVEEGTHAELLKKEDGTYARLVRMQQELHDMYVA
jgi:ATP-binding cassette, subfamily B, bacterial